MFDKAWRNIDIQGWSYTVFVLGLYFEVSCLEDRLLFLAWDCFLLMNLLERVEVWAEEHALADRWSLFTLVLGFDCLRLSEGI